MQSLTDPARQASLVRESRSLLDGVPAEVKALKSTRLWADQLRTTGA